MRLLARKYKNRAVHAFLKMSTEPVDGVDNYYLLATSNKHLSSLTTVSGILLSPAPNRPKGFKRRLHSHINRVRRTAVRYPAETIEAVRKHLLGYRDNMRVEVEYAIPVTAKTVADLRAATTWPAGLVLDILGLRHPCRP